MLTFAEICACLGLIVIALFTLETCMLAACYFHGRDDNLSTVHDDQHQLFLVHKHLVYFVCWKYPVEHTNVAVTASSSNVVYVRRILLFSFHILVCRQPLLYPLYIAVRPGRLRPIAIRSNVHHQTLSVARPSQSFSSTSRSFRCSMLSDHLFLGLTRGPLPAIVATIEPFTKLGR